MKKRLIDELSIIKKEELISIQGGNIQGELLFYINAQNMRFMV